MSRTRTIAASLLVLLVLACAFGDYLVPAASRTGFHAVDQRPSREFPLGTDELGRNRYVRMLQGARVSLAVAPLAALLSVTIGTLIGSLAALGHGWLNRLFEHGTDLLLSLPMIFALMLLRGALPLNTPPLATSILTFAFLACLSWVGPARVIRNAVLDQLASAHVLQARASGWRPRAILTSQILPAIRHLSFAQWWTSVPLFVIAEANLSLLGLGVPESTPSLGNLLRELESYGRVTEEPWCFAPALLLASVSICLWVAVSTGESQC